MGPDTEYPSIISATPVLSRGIKRGLQSSRSVVQFGQPGERKCLCPFEIDIIYVRIACNTQRSRRAYYP